MEQFTLKKGPVAEWLGRGLQNLVQRFESARDLTLGSCQNTSILAIHSRFS
jgi:hypothetical protein